MRRTRGICPNIPSTVGNISDSGVTDSGYLLVSTHRDEHDQATIRLVQLSTGQAIHEWIPDWQAILASIPADLPSPPVNAITDVALLEDSSVVFNIYDGPLVKLDAQSNIEWLVPLPFHHSIEIDADDHFWSPTATEGRSGNDRDRLRDDVITRVDPEGTIVYQRSVTDLLISQGYLNLLYGSGYEDDRTHLNDIQPTLSDGPFWMKGDVFLSFRHLSTVMQFRPRTDEIVRLIEGPWLNQHDVDILDSTRISILATTTSEMRQNSLAQRRGRYSSTLSSTSTTSTPNFCRPHSPKQWLQHA